MQPEPPASRRPSRRQFVVGSVAAGAVGAAAGFAGGHAVAAGPGPAGSPTDDELVEAHGLHQAGIDRPTLLQRHLELSVLDLDEQTELADTLDTVGQRIAALARGEDDALAGLAPARLTVTVGIGSRLVSTFLPGSPGSRDLPAFRRDEITPDRASGDLLLLCRSDDGAVAALARQSLTSVFSGRPRWSISGFTTAPDGPATRNILGFQDGLSIPRTTAEKQASVWIHGDPAADSSIAVVRVMPIDTAAFTALPLSDQQRAVGRERASGAPLSGGTANDDPDLSAKSDAGVYDIPADAHIRRAHPLPAGLDGLMLRRSYSFSSDGGDQGSIFVSFQRDVDFFVRTQLRLDESDALLERTRTTASGSFLVLPGFTPERPLGSSLRR